MTAKSKVKSDDLPLEDNVDWQGTTGRNPVAGFVTVGRRGLSVYDDPIFGYQEPGAGGAFVPFDDCVEIPSDTSSLCRVPETGEERLAWRMLGYMVKECLSGDTEAMAEIRHWLTEPQVEVWSTEHQRVVSKDDCDFSVSMLCELTGIDDDYFKRKMREFVDRCDRGESCGGTIPKGLRVAGNGALTSKPLPAAAAVSQLLS